MEDKAKESEENPRPMNEPQKEKLKENNPVECNPKRGRGRSLDSIGKVKLLQTLASQGGAEAELTTGSEFSPAVVIVEPREDLVEKVWSLGQKNGPSVCIFSATGTISKVDLAISSDFILKFEGICEILYVKGSNAQLFMRIVNAEGIVYDGTVSGPVIAAGRIQVIAATFRGKGTKRKYQTIGQSFESQGMMSLNHFEVPTTLKLMETNDHMIATSSQDCNKNNNGVDQSQIN